MQGKRPCEPQALADRIVADDVLVQTRKLNTNTTLINTKAPEEAGLGGLQVFRLLHVSPKLQKIMPSPAATLRGDHLAIAMASVESRDPHSRSLAAS